MDDHSQAKSSTTIWWVSVLLVPILYILSAGPIVRLTMSKSHPQRAPEWVETLYAPVEWLYEHTPLEKPLEEYMEWWLKGL
jgi:hypothetical protein